jgi:hypothetical protein
MTPEEQALLDQVKEILNQAGSNLEAEREEQHRHSMPYLSDMAAEVVAQLGSEQPIHFFAIVDEGFVGDALPEGMTMIDGTIPASPDNMIKTKFTHVQGFDDIDEACALMEDPETAIAFEGTMKDTGVFMTITHEEQRYEALMAANCLTLRRLMGNDSMTFYVKPREKNADEFFTDVKCPDAVRRLIMGLVQFRSAPQAMREQFPNTFEAMYEAWKRKMREAEGDE